MQKRNRVKFGCDLSFDRWDFEKWMLSTQYNKFVLLFQNWINSDYDSNLVPSIDRINFRKPYEFSNMQLITWRENNKKGIEEKKSIGVEHMNKSTRKAVKQFAMDGKFIATYESLSDAGRAVGTSTASICECCKGVRKTAKGFRWIYA